MVVLLKDLLPNAVGGLRMNLCSGRLPLWQLRWAGPSVARLGRDVHESCVGVPQHLCDVKAGALKGNAITITKQVSDTAKIDPLMAAFNAVAWMSANPASSQPSIFVI